MRIIYLFIIFTAILVSCHSADKDQTQSDEPSYDYLFRSLEKQQEQKKKDYISTMKKKSIVFEAMGDCDEDDSDSLSDLQHPVISVSEMKDSSLFLEFKFLDSCCQEFFGDYMIENDTLVFRFEPVGNSACDCYCWYTYKLSIEHIPESFSAFEVVYY